MIRKLAFEQVLHQYLVHEGVDPSRVTQTVIFAKAGREARLRQLAGFAMRTLQDPVLGLKLGRIMTISAYGLFGHALMNCSTLNQSVAFMLKHMWIFQSYPKDPVRLGHSARFLTLAYLQPPDWPEAPYFMVELFYSSYLSHIRELAGEPLGGVTLELTRMPEGLAETYEEILQVPVLFGAPRNQLFIPTELAHKPLAATYVGHSEAWLQQCDALLSRMRRTTGIVEQVRRIQMQARGGVCRMGDVARQLNMSERSLRRKLLAEGQTFQAIAGSVRNYIARTYLEDTTLSVADIAGLLGYCDTSTFRRAFLRWNSLSPSQYREEQERKKD